MKKNGEKKTEYECCWLLCQNYYAQRSRIGAPEGQNVSFWFGIYQYEISKKVNAKLLDQCDVIGCVFWRAV